MLYNEVFSSCSNVILWISAVVTVLLSLATVVPFSCAAAAAEEEGVGAVVVRKTAIWSCKAN